MTPEGLSAALESRYRIERELGAGGMATVYLAHDLKHDRKVAIKVLRPELAQALGPERFLREIQTTANLRHPHILPLYDSGRADGQTGGRAEEFLYYVMPYVEGESLRDRLDREKQLPLEDALRIAREVADALSYAHARGIVHRDIKPANILLESAHAVVADFGIAKAVTEAGGGWLTGTGMSVGTPQYMSPEQAAGEKDIDGRSDLYALGCVLYEMLAGQPPFVGPTAANVVHQHLTAEARPISQLRPAVPPAIADVLTRALAKNPADRFSPAAHFAEALTFPQGGSAQASRPASSRMIGIVAAVVAAAVVAVVLLTRRSTEAPAVTIGRTTQVTREPGLEVDPALSPDGASIAYAMGPTNAMQVYVRQVSGGRPVALTGDSTNNFRWPRWSPDGSRIIWSAGLNSDVLVVKTLSTGDTVAVPTPPGGAVAPTWSPDGRAVAVSIGNPAFIFGSGYFGNVGESSVWVVPLDGSPPTRVTTDSAMNVSPQWSPDGRTLFWVSDRGGSRDVYQQGLDARGATVGTPRRLTTGTDAQGLSVSRGSGRMAYSRLNTWSSIWSIPIPARGPVSIRGAARISTGNETIEDVDVSADGRWLAFDSDRSGNPELYVMPATGGEARQLTNDPSGDFSADWSPDGRRIVFHSLRTGNRDVFTVDADGTGLKQWTSGSEQELDPDWAPDGETVLFEKRGVTRPGFATLRLADGAAPGLIAAPDADFAHWSPVGRAIMYHAVDGIRVQHVDTGVDTLVVSNAADSAEAFYAAWSPDGGKIYYMARSVRGWTVRVVPATGGVSTMLVTLDDPTRQQTRYGFCTNGKLFYFTIGSPESDIYVADLSRP